MNFLQSLTKQVTKQPEKLTKKEEKEPESKVEIKKKTFSHSNNVIIKSGNYKGYYGSIYRIQPARYEILLKEIQYVFVRDYGKKQIGSTIFTEFGESKILEHIPILYNIIDEQTKESLRYPEQYIRRVVSFIDDEDKQLKLGLLSAIEEVKNRKLYIIHPYDLKYTSTDDTPEKLMNMLKSEMNKTKDHDSLLSSKTYQFSDETEQLTEKLRKNLTFTKKATEKMFKYVAEKNILSDMYIINLDDKNYAKYGSLLNIIDEQYMITYNVFTLVSQSNVKLHTNKKVGNIGDNCTILRGSFKNKKGTVIAVFPEVVTVFVDAAGKKINSIDFLKNGKMNTRSLTRKDLFYMDIRLKNGNYAEVKKILENENFIISEKAPLKESITREITQDEIDRFQTGFTTQISLVDKQSAQDITSDMELLEESMDETIDTTSDLITADEDDIESKEIEEYVEGDIETQMEVESREPKKGKRKLKEDEEESEKEEIPDEDADAGFLEDSDKFMSSYKDVERTQYVSRVLTKDEQSIKTIIITILNGFGLNESNIKMYNVIDNITNIMKKMKELVNKVMENYWKISDENYIISCVVLYELVKLENVYTLNLFKSGDIIEYYINKIKSFKKSFFKTSDLNSTILLTEGWTNVFTVNKDIIKTLIKDKNYDAIYKIMLQNCHLVIQSITPKDEQISLDKKMQAEEIEYIPLGIKKREQYVQRIIYSKDVIAGNIPETANKIIWGPHYQDTIEKYKILLKNKLAGNIFKADTKEWVFDKLPNKTTKDVYTYVLNNLEQAPITLREFKKQNTKLAQRMYSELERIFNLMLNDIREIDEKQKEKIQSKLKQTESEKESIKKKRSEIEIRNKLLGLSFLESEEGEPEDYSKPKRKKFR